MAGRPWFAWVPPAWRPWLGNLARLAVSAGLLAWLVAGSDGRQLWAILRRADLLLYAACSLISTAGMLLRTLRWKAVLDAAGARVSFRRALYLFYVGAFFNTFLPTGLGGDVVRVLEIGRGATAQQAVGTILVERLTGFAVLFALMLAVLPAAAAVLPAATVYGLGLLASGVLAAAGLVLEGRIIRRLLGWLGRWRLTRPLSLAGDTWLGQTYQVITSVGGRAVARALLISLIFNLSIIWSNWLAARALGLEIPVGLVAVALPVISATLLVPVSISGFGVREGVVVALLGQAGVGAPEALALSLAWYGLDMLDGLYGGLIYFLTGALGLRPRPAGDHPPQ
ncbi:MAG: flippase-like domain-containing protein [Anaerolineales bacterium]|nr:flippase-like domain-containing protein [Anaerolineales bacterium]